SLPITRPSASYTLSLHDALPIFERLVRAVESICKPAKEAKRPREAQKPRRGGADGIERELLRRAVASAEEACNGGGADGIRGRKDRKSTRLNSSHVKISYAVFCL